MCSSDLAGGNLHIVTDDDNIEDDHILFCLKEAEEDSMRESRDISIAIAKRYLNHSMRERMCLVFLTCDSKQAGCNECFVERGYDAWEECDRGSR